MKLPDAILAGLKSKAIGLAVDLSPKLADVASYAAQRAVDVSKLAGTPDFEGGVQAASDDVALYAGLRAVEAADAGDAALRGFLVDAVRIGAAALAGG